MDELEKLMESYKKVWATWDVTKLLERYRELDEQLTRTRKEHDAITESIKERLTCPRCPDNEGLELHFYKQWNSVECNHCFLEIPQYKTIEQALEAWDKVCQALSALEPEQPVEPNCPANEEFDND